MGTVEQDRFSDDGCPNQPGGPTPAQLLRLERALAIPQRVAMARVFKTRLPVPESALAKLTPELREAGLALLREEGLEPN